MMFIIMYYTENACFPFVYRLEVKSVESVASEVISLPSSEEDGDTAVISGMDSSIRNASRSDQPSKGQSVSNTVFKVQLRVLFMCLTDPSVTWAFVIKSFCLLQTLQLLALNQ